MMFEVSDVVAQKSNYNRLALIFRVWAQIRSGKFINETHESLIGLLANLETQPLLLV